MSIGIYCIYWEIDDSKVYVGQSNNIMQRYSTHINRLKSNTHTNYKLQEMFNLYGYPLHTILEECSTHTLDDKEQEWIKEFNSFNNGYNLTIGGNNFSAGTNNPASKYSEELLEIVFMQLVNTSNSTKQISKTTGVDVGIVRCIATGNNHTWLSTKYPTEWNTLTAVRRKVDPVDTNTYIGRQRPNTDITCYNVDNKDYTVVYTDSNLLGKLPHLGKRILNTNTSELFTVTSTIKELALRLGLDQNHLGAIFRKERKSHKGFILYEV